MTAMASQITRLTIVYSAVYLGVDQRKHQRSTSLVFVRGIHRCSVNSPHKGPLTHKMFPFDDIILSFTVFSLRGPRLSGTNLDNKKGWRHKRTTNGNTVYTMCWFLLWWRHSMDTLPALFALCGVINVNLRWFHCWCSEQAFEQTVEWPVNSNAATQCDVA